MPRCSCTLHHLHLVDMPKTSQNPPVDMENLLQRFGLLQQSQNEALGWDFRAKKITG